MSQQELEYLDSLTPEERQAMQHAKEDASAANELLTNPLVQRFFKNKVDELFNKFCSLKLGCPVEDYRELHLQIDSLNGLRLMLESLRTKGEREQFRMERLMMDSEEF